MKQCLILLGLVSILFACSSSDKNLDNYVNIPENTQSVQRQIVSVLSGASIIDQRGTKLSSRSTLKQRRICIEYLSSVIAQLSLKPVTHDYLAPNTNFFADLLIGPFKGTNLYTVLPSTTPSDEYVILGAHFDTAKGCPGANDNASSIALLYGVLRQLSEIPVRNMNVMIVFFDQEEEELIGSTAFARYISKENLNVHSVHTFDQNGWDEDGDKAIEIELPTQSLENLYRAHCKKMGIPLHLTRVNSTDHHSFREAGYPAVGVTEEYFNGDSTPYKDTINDTFDTINFEYLTSTTNLIFEVIKDIITRS